MFCTATACILHVYCISLYPSVYCIFPCILHVYFIPLYPSGYCLACILVYIISPCFLIAYIVSPCILCVYGVLWTPTVNKNNFYPYLNLDSPYVTIIPPTLLYSSSLHPYFSSLYPYTHLHYTSLLIFLLLNSSS